MKCILYKASVELFVIKYLKENIALHLYRYQNVHDVQSTKYPFVMFNFPTPNIWDLYLIMMEVMTVVLAAYDEKDAAIDDDVDDEEDNA